MNKKIVDYRVIAANFYALLGREVSDMIKQGWQPYGDPYSTVYQGSNNHYQAVVKYEE